MPTIAEGMCLRAVQIGGAAYAAGAERRSRSVSWREGRAAVSGRDAGVGGVDRVLEVGGHNGEADGGEHGFEQPREGAELGAQALLKASSRWA